LWHECSLWKTLGSNRKSVNTIWELTNREGRKVDNFQDLAKLEVQHFEEVFKQPKKANIEEILKVASYFLLLVGEEENEMMYKVVT
jgi:hypothetical protein